MQLNFPVTFLGPNPPLHTGNTHEFVRLRDDTMSKIKKVSFLSLLNYFIYEWLRGWNKKKLKLNHEPGHFCTHW